MSANLRKKENFTMLKSTRWCLLFILTIKWNDMYYFFKSVLIEQILFTSQITSRCFQQNTHQLSVHHVPK